jgi:hypothetical protein
MPVRIICPTIFDVPQFENLRRVQQASFKGVGEIDYIGETWTGWMESYKTDHKIVDGFKKAYLDDDIMDHGYVIVTHHDTILENEDLLWDLMRYIRAEGFAVAGQTECDGLQRNNHNGKFYVHSSFLVADPRKVGNWWPESWIDNGWIDKGESFTLRGMEGYWKICHEVMGNILYLNTSWRFPRLGKSTTIDWQKSPLISHLWLSTLDIRAHKGFNTWEGTTGPEGAAWRKEWCEYYAERFDVDLIECEDTVRGEDYYRTWQDREKVS